MGNSEKDWNTQRGKMKGTKAATTLTGHRASTASGKRKLQVQEKMELWDAEETKAQTASHTCLQPLVPKFEPEGF